MTALEHNQGFSVVDLNASVTWLLSGYPCFLPKARNIHLDDCNLTLNESVNT